jgi:nicotinic acid mononucleotide adenylyltransferase
MLRTFASLALCFTLSLNGLVLENLQLDNKRLGYFVGSFDPIHKGHEAICETALQHNLCDYILIYPAWGGDSYKVRSDITLRLDMLFALYEQHPQVIVTRLCPKELQDFCQPLACHCIGIIGSDTALYLADNPDTSIYYMTGKPITKEYEKHTWGSCMALKVDSFIVAMRQGDDITHLNAHLRERPIIATLNIGKANSISSTQIKQKLKQGEPIDELVSGPIQQLL